MRNALASLALLLAACAPAPLAGPAVAPAPVLAAAGGYARFVAPDAVPAAIAARARAQAQLDADAASKRRGIDYFALPEAPLGLAIGTGEEKAWVLGFLGTGKTDGDLNVELHALVSGARVGTAMAYSGPTTLGRFDAGVPAPTFELVEGGLPDPVEGSYGAYMDALAGQLRQRYDARPFGWNDPLPVAILENGQPTSFVLINQRNKLVLGERKYADIQSIACLTPGGQLAAAYTIVAFNAKTTGPGAAPRWRFENDGRFGALALCGELP
jgi:hypothetical protein